MCLHEEGYPAVAICLPKQCGLFDRSRSRLEFWTDTSFADYASKYYGLQYDQVSNELGVSDDDSDGTIANGQVDVGITENAGQFPDPQQSSSESPCPFGTTTQHRALHDLRGVAVSTDLHANFAKSYLKGNTTGKAYHITYRRNYFAVAMHYQLKLPVGPVGGNLYVIDGNASHPVTALSMRMRAVKNHEQGEDVALSSFTTKRGRPIYPSPPLVQKMQPNMAGSPQVYVESTGHGCSVLDRPIHHTFSHLQYRKATDNNGIRRKGQFFFHIVVELVASFVSASGKEDSLLVASTMSGPLLVRGRCPNSFEPHNPSNKKRKPAKVQVGKVRTGKVQTGKVHSIQGIKKRQSSSKKQGRATSAAMTAARKWNRRPASTVTSSTTPTTPDSAPGAYTPTVTELTQPSERTSPMMVERYKIPVHLRLPSPNAFHQPPLFPPTDENPFSDDLLEEFEDVLSQPPPDSIYWDLICHTVDPQTQGMASELNSFDVGFNSLRFVIPNPSSAFDFQRHRNVSAGSGVTANHMYGKHMAG